jgi:hypothetical protein
MATGPVTTDAYGHLQRLGGPTTLTAAANGVTTPGTIAVATAGAGAGSSVSVSAAQTPNDLRGTFTVTGAGTPAAGIVAHVNFAQPYARVPAVLVNLTSATNTSIQASAANVTVNGFDLYAASAVSVGANAASYVVIP